MDYTAWIKTMGSVLININKCLPENEEQKMMMGMDVERSLSLWPHENRQSAFNPINDELETYYED